MFLDAFFFANFGTFFLYTPLPIPTFGIRSGVKGQRSFPPESRGEGWG